VIPSAAREDREPLTGEDSGHYSWSARHVRSGLGVSATALLPPDACLSWCAPAESGRSCEAPSDGLPPRSARGTGERAQPGNSRKPHDSPES
jgi:hypothetical protein